MFTLRKKNFSFNKRSRRARQHQKSNEIWQLSIQRYVFLLVFSDKCTQDVFKIVCLEIEATGRCSVKLFEKNICENNYAKYLYAKTIIYLSVSEWCRYL